MDAAPPALNCTGMSRASTLISVATYNEIDNLPRLVDDILAVLPEAEILVIDDNSPDGTGQWCDARSAATAASAACTASANWASARQSSQA